MRSILTIFITFHSFFGYSQDTINITHSNYSVLFSTSKKYPILVEWWITKDKVSCKNPIPRKNIFYPDPNIPEITNLEKSYKKSGFDRGHMSPAADNQCQSKEILKESFYYTNISAQYHSLNAGEWKKLEIYCRDLSKKYDSIHVWSGNLGEIKKIGDVSVPEICWKAILIKKTGQLMFFMFKNSKEKNKPFEKSMVDESDFRKQVKFEFIK